MIIAPASDFVTVSGNETITGNKTFSGTTTINSTVFAGDATFSPSGGFTLRGNTSDGSDSQALYLAAGGAAAATRGFWLAGYGNEFGAGVGGAVVIAAGSGPAAPVAGEGRIRFATSGTDRAYFERTGGLYLSTALEMGSNGITCTGTLTLTGATITGGTFGSSTLTAPAINGTVTTTGLTLPAFTASGTIAGSGSPTLSGFGTVSATTLTGTLSTAAQTTITSVGTLTGLTMGGAINCVNNVITNIGAAGTDFTATGGLTLADILTVTAGGQTITAGNLGVGAAPNARYGAYVSENLSAGGSQDASYFRCDGTVTKTASTGNMMGLYTGIAATINGGVTCDRLASVWADGITATVTGTLTNHNALYCGTPVNGSTVRVIDSAAGGYLATTGVWTDAPSFASLKRNIMPVATSELDGLFDWFGREFRPVRYRYADHYVTEVRNGKMVRTLARYERDDVDYAHLGYLHEDLQANPIGRKVFEIVCADAGGGVSGKDERGLAFAMLHVAAQRIQALETRLEQAGIN